jgi:hypothetical protein
VSTETVGSIGVPQTGTVVDLGVSEKWGKAAATFSEDRLFRYALDRVWDPDLPVTCFIMLNPSTADAFKVDPTVNRCLGYARDWGSGGLMVLNAFALRSTDPKALYGHPCPVGPENDRIIRETLHRFQPAQVVAGWGEHAAKIDHLGRTRKQYEACRLPGEYGQPWRSRAERIADLLGDRLMALRVTKDGNPGHPLYLPAHLKPVPWQPPSGRP